jgi:hypothetical protein
MRSIVPFVILALAAAAAPVAASAAPTATVTCHCFRNRSFDPADPPAADPYILAATRSSLLSASFGVAKGPLVKAVMTGTAPEDLWVAHWSAARTGRTASFLLDALSETGSWRVALAGTKGLSAEFEAALGKGASSVELAALAVDDVLAARLGADRSGIGALRASGATSEQVIVATFLAGRLKVPAADLLARFRAGKATWGTLLNEAGLAPEQIEAAIRGAVR